MEGDGEKKINLEVEDKLIDISLENDSLIASPIVDSLEDLRLSVTLKNTKQHEGYKLSGASSSLEVNNAAEVLLPKEQKHLFSESMEPARPSLDWNSAFFTSPGILKPNELPNFNKGFKLNSIPAVDQKKKKNPYQLPKCKAAICKDQLLKEKRRPSFAHKYHHRHPRRAK